MGYLNHLLLISLFFFTSCAKTKYIIEQGSGQASLLWNAIDNEEVLNDPKVKEDIKIKIKKIKIFKNHFYKYWNKSPSEIYSKTTFLKGKAVTYLVISSKYYQIKPLQECFPFMGCFPYIGFFNNKSAKTYREDKEDDNFETYMRPVYAYSTLGYFTDTILSSFFYYKEVELSELIFHELFHTIFFVKNEVALNENLANYFSKKMTAQYFDLKTKKKVNSKKNKNSEKIRAKLVELIKELNLVYKDSGGEKITKEVANLKREEFLKTRFNPEFRKLCSENNIDNCFPLNRKWNNASFAAYMTYSKKVDKLRLLHNKLALDLKSFYLYIEKEYNAFKKESVKGKFETYLFREL